MPRHTYWVDTSLDGVSATSGGAGNIRLGTADGNFITERMATVIRTIWNIDAASTTVAGAWGVQLLSYGIGIITLEAFNAGVFPDPATMSDFPVRGWILRGECLVSQNGVGTAIIKSCVGDLRNARKIDNGVLVFSIQNTAVQGTSFTIVVGGLIRNLIKGG